VQTGPHSEPTTPREERHSAVARPAAEEAATSQYCAPSVDGPGIPFLHTEGGNRSIARRVFRAAESPPGFFHDKPPVRALVDGILKAERPAVPLAGDGGDIAGGCVGRLPGRKPSAATAAGSPRSAACQAARRRLSLGCRWRRSDERRGCHGGGRGPFVHPGGY
jgi:hypothetical protein